MLAAVAALCLVGATVPTVAAAPATGVQPLGPGPAPIPQGAVAVGAVPSQQQIPLDIVLAPADPAGAQSLLARLYDPTSPQYHHWLNPGEFQASFGPAPTEVASTEAWLQGKGLVGSTVSGAAVHVTAPAGKIAAALGTSLQRLRTRTGEVGYRAQKAPLVPADLVHGTVRAILGLDTVTRFQPAGVARAASAARPDVTTQPSVAPAADGLKTCAPAQSAAGPGYYTLDALGQAYGVGSLIADGENGHGQTVGVYELGAHSTSDVHTYQACFGLSNPVSTVPVDGGANVLDKGGTAEADLDIEQIATQSPAAAIVSYEGPNSQSGAYDTWSAIVKADATQVISTSWDECELDAVSDGDLPAYTPLFEQAAAQGQTILAASGDSGSEGCYVSSGSPGLTAAEVDYPASDPWVTTVGGTSRYGPGSEVTWNSCQTDESTACASADGGQAAGGGGMSRYEPRPSVQPNAARWPTAQPCGSTCRQVPDISANAGVGMVTLENGGWVPLIGTSAAAPFIAGLVADKNDGCTTTTGLFTPALYGLAAAGGYGTALNDITQGDNDMTGSLGGADKATTGYDLATGLGSPIAPGLSCPEITSMQPATGVAGTQVTVSGLGLGAATFSFGTAVAQVVSATATSATVIVPPGAATVAVTAQSVLGSGTQLGSFTYTTASAPGDVYVPLSSPQRVTDTRSGSGQANAGKSIRFGQSLNVAFGGSVPTGATAVVVNVTAADGASPGFLTAYPTGSAPPTTSNLNYVAGPPNCGVLDCVVPNLATVPLGAGGQISILNSSTGPPGATDAIVDLEGYYLPAGASSAGQYHPSAPTRIVDTRCSRSPVPGPCAGEGLVAPNAALAAVPGSGTLRVAVGNAAAAEAVVLNVTVTNTAAGGYLSVFPDGTSIPTSSNGNWVRGQTAANRVIAPVGADGSVDLYNASPGSLDVVVDAVGYYATSTGAPPGGSLFVPTSPTRITDTRSGSGQANAGATLGPAGNLVVGVPDVPSGATAVALNVTDATATADGFFALTPTATPGGPPSSDLNFRAGEIRANADLATLSQAGTFDLFSYSGRANAVVDMFGYFVPAGS